MSSDPTPLSAARYHSVVRPHQALVVIGAAVAGVGVVTGLLVASTGGWEIALGVVVLALLVGLGWLVARGPVTVTVTDHAIRVRYPLAPRTIAIEDVTDVGAGDHVDGIGWGHGLRWEGRGRWAYRVGGPMATVVHRRGRLGLSVEDPCAFVEAVVAARQGLG